MKLYKLKSDNFEAFFGTEDRESLDEEAHLNGIERNVIPIAQTPSQDAFLYLSNETYDELELLDSVPSGFDFTYCQAWGLTVDDDVIDRVIIDLRKKAYPLLEDQLDMQYHDQLDGTTTWEDAVAKVKSDHPKV